jgi:diaminopimelate decarboxylase
LTPTDSLDVDTRGHLHIEGCSAVELTRRFGSPLYVVSERTLRANVRAIRDAFERRWPEQVNVLYATKANYGLAIRAIVHQEGAGADCVGLGELAATLAGGVDTARLSLSGSNKTREELWRAVELGALTNVDGEDELVHLREAATALRRAARVTLRLKVAPRNLDDLPVEYPVRVPSLRAHILSAQWGFSSAAAQRLIPLIQNAPELNLQGYHVHVGRASREPGFHAAWARAVGETVVELRQRTGFAPVVLDIGGGFARRRDPESGRLDLNPHDINEYADAVCGALLDSLCRARIRTPDLWLEPGRYIVGNSVVLLCTVGSIKRDLGKTWVHVDCSINDLMRIETAHSSYHVLPATRMYNAAREPVDIVGPLCTGAPLGAARQMPILERGDVLAILDAGMYAEAASTQFSAMPRPATVLVDGADADVVTTRETIEDVLARYRLPDRLKKASYADRSTTQPAAALGAPA